jgi:hypothetical protein|tara:strand:+ start:108 stop:428 length:321 start_codon:yes stop_codon:yes gene_type:complete
MAKDKISYSWQINALDAKIKEDKHDNVIYNVHWSYYANKGDHNVNSIGTYYMVYDKDNFIDYDKLKKSDVVGWLEAGLDVDSMKSNLSNQISILEKPVDIVLRPDW